MIHENWIPIEMFDKEKYAGRNMVFATVYQPGDSIWITAGQWDFILVGKWKAWAFYSGDISFEPTHYLNPDCYESRMK